VPLPPPPYEKSVFINCPYDDQFAPLFNAIVLTTAARGFTPRSARESEGESEPRILRIAKSLMTSRYSIHDLSRFQGEGVENLARFNMPLELGMAMAIRWMKDGTPVPPHNWMALVPTGGAHQKFASDLVAYDLRDHDSQVVTVIKRVAGWLSELPDFTEPTPSAQTILAAFQNFQAQLDQAKQEALGDLRWPAIVKNAQGIVSQMPVAAV
jgi:hypothetical protein